MEKLNFWCGLARFLSCLYGPPTKNVAQPWSITVCLFLICIHVGEDSVTGSFFNVNWSLLFVFTFVIASCIVGLFFSCVFVFLILL